MKVEQWFFSETENLVVFDLICPNKNPDEPFKRKVFRRDQREENLSDLLNNLNQCPHALSGKTLTVSSSGTIPFLFTDFDRNIVYNEQGKPLGSNTDIPVTIGKMYGFDVNVYIYNGPHFFDNKTGQWVGQTGDVSCQRKLLLNS